MDYYGNLPQPALGSNGLEAIGMHVNKILKKKRHRTAFTTDQLMILEKTFSDTKYIDREKRKKLANTLMINEKSVKVWFQNRRMKNKRVSDSSCDSSSDISVSTHVKSDVSTHVKIDPTIDNMGYQLPNPYNSSPQLNNHNFYHQYDHHQSYDYSDYGPMSTSGAFTNGEIHTQYYPHDYQCHVDYNIYEYNHNWPQQKTNMCYL